MKTLLEYQKKLLPDLLQVMQNRYEILRHIRTMQPIGRRSLAVSVGLTERVLRSEVQFLKEQQLIDVQPSGMTVTEEGMDVLLMLEDAMKELYGTTELERKLKEMLHLEEVVVVGGDSDTSLSVKKEMARASVMCIKRRIAANNTIAVTGGSTLAEVADMMKSDAEELHLLFVSARGGLGENVVSQANTICAKMAQRMKGDYRLLHVPDQLSDEAYASIIEEPSVKNVIDLIKSADMLIHGIGDAFAMAERRNTPPEDIAMLKERKAVSEAFGYYFDEQGNVVHKLLTVGMQLQDVKKVPNVISIAGGASKAKAIHSFMKQRCSTVLVTDEGAAKRLIRDYLPLNIKKEETQGGSLHGS